MTHPRVFPVSHRCSFTSEHRRGVPLPHRPGFTLLELLLASALTTLLMVGVLGIVAQVGLPARQPSDAASPDAASPDAASRDAASRDAALRGFADVLRLDLEHAASIDVTKPNRVELLGYGSLDAETRRRTHRPVRIVYHIARIGDRRWLLREQRRLDVPTNRNVQRDLVAAGVRGFELSHVPLTPDRLAGEAQPPSVAQAPDVAAAPDLSAAESPVADDREPAASATATTASASAAAASTTGMQPVHGKAWRLTMFRGRHEQTPEPAWQQWVSLRGGAR